MIKRLAILIIYDPDGIADDYIFYLIEALKKNVTQLAVVCNGEMQPNDIERLKKCADYTFVRENKGFDCGAFKDVLTNLIGWDEVYEYDELVLVNDSCYGPLFPLEEVFDTMAKRSCDYWCITMGGAMLRNFGNDSALWPEHIQPYFLTVRSNMLKSLDFRRFWDELKYPETYLEAVTQYELRFTDFFTDLGYKASTYINSDAFFDTPERNLPYVFFDSYRLIAESRCPFVKRKVFALKDDMLRYNSGETARKTLDYITSQTEYPENLIWKHLLRLCDINVLRSSLHLDYIFPSTVQLYQQIPQKKRTAVIAHLYYTDLAELCLAYINRIPNDIDVIITTNGEENRRKIIECFAESGRKNYRVIEPENRGREIGALLVACKDLLMEYEYLCFVHDKKSGSRTHYMTVGRSFMDLLWENSLKSGQYIENVLACFEHNPLLGFLSPPSPYMSFFFTMSTWSWLTNYEETSHLAERLKLRCKISQQHYPFTLGTVFWCRTAALKALFEHGFQYEDFCPEPMPLDNTISHAIERIFPYVAQHEGYYSGIMMTTEYASLYASNFQYMLNSLIFDKFKKFGITEFNDIINSDLHSMAQFCEKYTKIYVYGAGAFAAMCIKIFREEISQFMGYIVSDGRKVENRLMTGHVFELSEISPRDDEGIIVALNRNNEQEVFPELKKRGFKNIISFSGSKQ